MFSDPIKNLKALGLHENSIVADLGAGTGFYSVAVGHIVTRGKVYAVEIMKDFLATISQKVKEAHLNNVEIIWGNIEKVGGTKIKEGVVDAVIASNVLFQVEDKNKFIEEIKRILKKGGRVLLIDWSDSPAAGTAEHALIKKEEARGLFERQGFSLVGQIDAGAHHYGMILVKNNE